MKKLIGLLAGLLVAGIVHAVPDGTSLDLANVKWTNSTQASATSGSLEGYIEAMEIILTSTPVGTNAITVTVVTNNGNQAQQTLFSSTNVTASGYYRLRYPTHASDGNALGVATNDYERFILCGEQVTITANSNDATQTNSISIRLKLWK